MSAQIVSVSLRQFASATEAKASFQALVDALKTCRSETYKGTKSTYSAMSTPKLGDGAVGVQIDADGAKLVTTDGGGLVNTDVDAAVKLPTAQVNRYMAAAAR